MTRRFPLALAFSFAFTLWERWKRVIEAAQVKVD